MNSETTSTSKYTGQLPHVVRLALEEYRQTGAYKDVEEIEAVCQILYSGGFWGRMAAKSRWKLNRLREHIVARVQSLKKEQGAFDSGGLPHRAAACDRGRIELERIYELLDEQWEGNEHPWHVSVEQNGRGQWNVVIERDNLPPASIDSYTEQARAEHVANQWRVALGIPTKVVR